MTAPYVCSKCCRRLVHRAVRSGIGNGQQQRAASSHALDKIVDEPPQTTRYSRRPLPSSKVSTSDTPFTGNFVDYVASIGGRSSTHPKQPLAKAVGRRREKRAYIAELEDLLNNDNVVEAWSFFQREFQSRDSPAIENHAYQDVAKHKNRIVYSKLLGFLTERWLTAQLHPTPPADASSLPSPVEVLRKFDDLGLSAPFMFQSSLWSLASTLEFAAPGGVDVSIESPATFVLVQLLELWPRCLFYKSKPNGDKGYDASIARLFTKREQALSNGAGAMLLTHDLLRDLPSLPTELEQHNSLITSMRRVMSITPISKSQLESLETMLKRGGKRGGLPLEATQDIITRFTERFSVTGSGVGQRERTPQHFESVPQFVSQTTKLVSFAMERQNLDRVERLWSSAKCFLNSEHSQGFKHSSLLLRVYEQFLVAFFELRRPQSAIQVWSDMLASGLEPTVRTWNVMMKSCHISRDIEIMESMWQRMRDSGLQPDAVSWGTRIYGLLRVGPVQDGLRALDQMGREWLAAQQQQTKNTLSNPADYSVAVKPNTAILNSAISALRGKRSQHIPKVLAWSRSFDIEPDIITFNALLHVALSHGEAGEATKILQRMAASNVQPDSATFTVLLNSMVYSSLLKELSPAEQEEKIMGLIESCEQCGLNIDQQGYALLIDRMLKEYNNAQAAYTILAHMDARRIKRTPHIYTILVTHSFDSDPPDLRHAERLWEDIRNGKHSSGSGGTGLDVIFFDRMMEGYARHGEVGRTMAILNLMSEEGKRPGWLALAAVVKCLAQANDWDRLAQTVKDCHNLEGVFKIGLRGRKGQKEFWNLVGDLTLDQYHTQIGKELLEIVDLQKQYYS